MESGAGPGSPSRLVPGPGSSRNRVLTTRVLVLAGRRTRFTPFARKMVW